MSRVYLSAIRRRAGSMTDEQLREMGMSNHDLIRIRALPPEQQVEEIADFVIERAFRIID